MLAGYQRELEWAAHIKPCETPMEFWLEYTHVVVNSGMKAQIAQKTFQKIVDAKQDHRLATEAFGHKQKARAIDDMWLDQDWTFKEWQAAHDKLAYLETLPWIGGITKCHLAKNLGMDVCKPDRHLVRVADDEGCSPKELCGRLSKESGDRVSLVDTVLWRSANLGLL